MIHIEEITEYFDGLFRSLGQKVLVEKQDLLNNFTIGGFGTACIELCYSLIYYPKGTEIKSIVVQDGYEGAKNLPDKIYMALVT